MGTLRGNMIPRVRPSDIAYPVDDEGLPADLTAKQRTFVTEYMRDRNSTRAYLEAFGCTPARAVQGGFNILAHPRVRAAVQALEAEQIAQVQLDSGVTLQRVIEQIAKAAFFDPRKLFDANGDPIPLDQLDEATASNIAGLEVATVPLVGTVVRKYKLASRNTALDMLMKHLGGYAKDNAIDLTVRKAEDVPIAELARRAAYLFRVGLEAANDQGSPPRQAAS